MRTDFSEFSYGMAVTHEVITRLGGATGLRAAPVMPSLRDEVTGGYDLRLDTVVGGVYLQFKRPELLVGPRAAERAHFGGDYFRFPLRNTTKSPQHSTLCALQHRLHGRNDWVAYASPIFHTTVELDHLFRRGHVCDRSVFVNPLQIGDFPPGTVPAHSVGYTGPHDAAKCSEPLAVGTTSWGLVQNLVTRTSQDAGSGVPLRAYLVNLLGVDPLLGRELDLDQLVAEAIALSVRLDIQIVLLGAASADESNATRG